MYPPVEGAGKGGTEACRWTCVRRQKRCPDSRFRKMSITGNPWGKNPRGKANPLIGIGEGMNKKFRFRGEKH